MTKSSADSAARVLIYSPYWPSFGGGEKYVLALAGALAQLPNMRVTLLSSDPSVKKVAFENYFGLRLPDIEFRTVSDESDSLRAATLDADLFIAISNFRFIGSRSRRSAFLLQVPFAPFSTLSFLGKVVKGQLKEAAKDLSRRNMFIRIRNDIDLTVVNSQFVHDTLLRNYGVRSSVLYPPIFDFALKNVRRQNIILSVGRFFRGLYNDKRYDILTKSFRTLCRSELKGWQYHIIGSCSEDAASTTFLKGLKKENEGFPVFFHVNETHAVLRRLYNETSIFWHGAGFGGDEKRHPERMEHFGMATAEAMSAGCIPVVINKGGQKEIVTHGSTGFLWDTTEELAEFTLKIARNKVLAGELRRHAREQFQRFSTKRFQQEVIGLFSPLLASK